MDRTTTHALIEKARSQHRLLEPANLPRGVDLRDLVRDGLWQEVLPGVLGPSAVQVSRELRESAAMLWPGKVVLSHFSAARKAGFWVPEDERAWVSVEFGSRRRDLPGLKVVRTRNLLPTSVKDGFHQWTPPRRTIVDLASYLSSKQLEASFLSAIRLKATTPAEVAAAAVGLERRRGINNLWDLLGLWSPERETLLEGKLYEHVRAVVTSGVERQWVVTSADGTKQARFDVAIPGLRLAFEADGLYFHSTDAQIAADQQRDRWTAGCGWLTSRFREGALDDGPGVQYDVSQIVERRRQDLRVA